MQFIIDEGSLYRGKIRGPSTSYSFMRSSFMSVFMQAWLLVLIQEVRVHYGQFLQNKYIYYMYLECQWVWATQEVTKICRLSLLTNSALVYESECRGMGGGGVEVAGSQPMSTAVHITWHGAQINFGDLPPYSWTFGATGLMWQSVACIKSYLEIYMGVMSWMEGPRFPEYLSQKDDDHGICLVEINLETMTVWHRRLQGENET
jgi:hypothetical protein